MKYLVKVNLIGVLALLTPFFLALAYLFRYNQVLELEVVIFFALLYLVLTFLHHYKDKTLRFEVMIEYILIAVLSLIMVQSLLF